VAWKLPITNLCCQAATREIDHIKRIIAIACVGVFSLSLATAGEPSQAEQKWLTVIEKKAGQGDTQVSTPSEERVNLLKEWAGKNNYSVTVRKSEGSYRMKLSKSLAKK
jgi:hypothetical protein